MKQAYAALLSIMMLAAPNASGEFLRLQRGALPPSAQQRQPPRRYPNGVAPGTPTATALDNFNEWIKTGNNTSIKWKTNVSAPTLMMTQKFSVPYSVTTRVKDLKRMGIDREVVFLFRVDKIESAGKNQSVPVHASILVPKDAPPNIELVFSHGAVLEPGDYYVWFALYDGADKTHNVTGRAIHVAVPNDPLPNLRFHATTGKILLPVSNRNPLAVHLISVYPDPGILEMLSQLTLVDSSISAEIVDLEKQQVIFEQTDARELDLRRFRQARAIEPENPTIDLSTILEPPRQLKQQPELKPGTYFEEFMRNKLEKPSEVFRVFILLSNARLLPSDKNSARLKATSNCRCLVIHLQDSKAVFDDVQNLLKPLQPWRIEFRTSLELRMALAEIIRKLESL